MRRLLQLLAGLLVTALVLSACTSQSVITDPVVSGGDSARSTPEPSPAASPTLDPTPERAVAPTPTPESTGVPGPTSTPDPTPVILTGDDWVITEADVMRLVAFVEDVHELEFRAPVGVKSDDDIGASFAQGLEVLAEDDWRLMVALGLIDADVDRDVINQIRRDRIRGVCCESDDGQLVVVVEPRATRLETEVIVVHELVHALHRQHGEILGRQGRSGGFEVPSPYDSVIEGVAQFVAFRYLDTHSEQDQAPVLPELPVITPDLEDQVGRVPAAMLNFAYSTAPNLAEAAYEARGAKGLSDLLATPPTTTEQVVFADRWLVGEDRVSQDAPAIPEEAGFVTEGRLGVAVLGWMIDELTSADERAEVLSAWTGDRWSLYRLDDRDCVAATVEMDNAAAAERMAALLGEWLDQTLVSDAERRIRFDTCGAAYRSGAEVLLDDQLELLAGMNVGLIANPASQIDGRSTIDLFAEASAFDLVSLFAPEHGVRGDLGAGELVPGGIDDATGVVVHSLYGATRSPSPEQLADIDVLVYDLQDAGTRFYTFISTMGLAMQAAAAADVEFLILDRPNPHGLARSSGFVLELGFESFVGQYPIPASYALTPGELAAAVVGEAWLPGLEGLQLTVVPMSGWSRSTGWAGTGDEWVAPSPGLPSIDSVLAYPGTVLFEATDASVARCTDFTFAAIAVASVDATGLTEQLNAAALPGVSFSDVVLPPCPDSSDPTVPGTRWTVTDPAELDAVAAGVHAMAFADQPAAAPVINRPDFLDLLAGTDRLRTLIEADVSPSEIVASWQSEAAAFDTAMVPYRIYPD